ncbi:CheR family methyltransferase [Asticcacaulis tiandongensis]|uniref:CheR family methyltransferase n=1 Tax=Asticcacaulis tiandongensis TaxID=2565365 RepID=UPI00112D7F22|nr:CheR family methyltransferase [Asticcacaulis tiandongensis]
MPQLLPPVTLPNLTQNQKPPQIEDIELRLFLEAVFLKYHYDFRGYALASIKRRLLQACQKYECATFSDLQGLILRDPALMAELLAYLTVQVSELFRDPSYFRAIREKVVPHLKTYPSLKVWVAGCSTGEELYSMAILFREEGLEERTMFYATDINPEALKQAQAGVYSIDRIQTFTENHRQSGGKSSLSDYYTAAYGWATFDKSLRARTVFSDHSLATDAVFAETQFVSCRNVLIYFNRPLQTRAIGLFHESLSRNGFLGLGSRETLRFTSYADEFTEFSYGDRLYQKRGEG